MPVSANDIAAVFRERLPGLPTKKLHKLLYYCQGHHLGAFAEPLFGETVSAWDMGPVVGQLWRQEKMGIAGRSARELDEAALNTIGYVLSHYGELSGSDLEDMTHGEQPWQLADIEREPAGSARIELEWMTEFFAPEEVSPQVAQWLSQAADRPSNPDTVEAIEARLAASAA